MPQDSTLRDLDHLFAASRAVRRRFEWQVYLNLAFYAGHQWVAWDGSRLFEPAVEEWREKVVDNRIQPFVRTEIAKMTKTRPQWVGVPRTQSDEDVGAARYAEMALEDAWKRHGMLRKLRAALLWSRIAGAGFWKVWWDPTLGSSKQVLVYGQDHPQAGQAVKDGYGAPVTDPQALPPDVAAATEPRTVAMGDLCFELRTFFDMYPDPLCGEEGLESAEWVGEEAVYSRDYAQRHFPDKAAELTYDAAPSPGVSESRMPSLLGASDPSMPQAAKGVRIREYWSKDKHCIWAKDTLLREEANPYPWLPYVMFRGVPVPGRLWPDAVVTQARPRQVDLNKRESQISENAERIGNPPRYIPASLADEDNWQGLPGEEVIYQDGLPEKPGFMPVPEIPAYVQADVDRIERSLMEIFGQHEVSSAQVPAGVTAASAIQLLQEQDDTRLGPDVADMEEALSNVGTRALYLIKTYYTDERHLHVAGDDGRWDVEAFKGDKLKGADDIDVQSGSGIPQSQAAKQAAIGQMLGYFIQNQTPLSERALHKVMSEYGVAGLNQFFASIGRDEQQINEENRQMTLGAELPINSYDNDQAHVEGHQDFQKTSRYSALPPQAKAIFEQHVQAHRDRMDAAAFAQQQPGPAPPGPPSPPGRGASSSTGAAAPLPSVLSSTT
jgi:hypothetical protein